MRLDFLTDVNAQQIFAYDQRSRVILSRRGNQIFCRGIAEQQEMIIDGKLRFDPRKNFTGLLRRGVIAGDSFELLRRFRLPRSGESSFR